MMLSYDQIPPGRLPLLDYAARLGDEGHAGVLGVALARWAARADDKPDADARQAANTALDEIDAMLAELHRLRSRLITETRESDDQTAVRVDALIGQSKKDPR